MYARCMTVREIREFLLEQYGTHVSPEFVSSVTDEVMAQVTAWQSKALESMCPVVFFDALRVKIREDAVVRNKVVYLALGVAADGTRDILGLWIENTEGAKFWLKVFNDLKTRGVDDILIAMTDGLKGMPEALEAVFPATTLQTCIVHLIRNSLAYASWKERKPLVAAIKPIYTAPSDEAATKLIWLALRNITKKWSRSAYDWKTAMNQFAILFAERFVQTSCDHSTRPEHEIPDRLPRPGWKAISGGRENSDQTIFHPIPVGLISILITSIKKRCFRGSLNFGCDG